MRYQVSRRKVCAALVFPRSSHYYQSRRDPQEALRIRLRDLAASRVRYGYRRLYVLLRREGWTINHKRVYRLYKQEGLIMRRKSPRRTVSCRVWENLPVVEAINQVWAMDFLSDTLSDGRKVRVLTVLDVFTRESLAIRADFRFSREQVVRVLEELMYTRGVPRSVRLDNGPEFTGTMLDLWAYFNKVTLDFSRPGKPTDNAFNGRFRQECLDQHWFTCLDDARVKMEAWRMRYNTEHSHSALGNLAPEEFAASQAGKVGPNRASKLA